VLAGESQDLARLGQQAGLLHHLQVWLLAHSHGKGLAEYVVGSYHQDAPHFRSAFRSEKVRVDA
jgi:hypothetical protein